MSEEQNNLQNTADRLKVLGLASGIHNLVPPAMHESSDGREVAIVNALKAEQHVIKAIYTVKGFMIDPIQNRWVQYRDPVMNTLGVGNFISVIQTIAETFEYGNVKGEDLPRRAIYFYKKNIVYFFIYHQEYGLEKKDFNIIDTALSSFIVSALDKALEAGHRRTITKTYSEDLLGRAFNQGQPQQQGGSSFLSKLANVNPFARKRQ